jgi:hypothetical protein
VRRLPRQHLHADFVRAVRASGYSLVALAAFANFSAYTHLSKLLNERQVRTSALTMQRVQALAAFIGYSGPIFREVTR